MQALAQVLGLALPLHSIQVASDLVTLRVWRLPHRVQVRLVSLMLTLLDLGELDRIVIIDILIIVLVVAVVDLRCVSGARMLWDVAATLIMNRATMLTQRLMSLITTTTDAARLCVARRLEHGTVYVRASRSMMHVALVHTLRLVPLLSMHLVLGRVADAVLIEAAGARFVPILVSISR